MKERSILFSAPMVRAIRAGKKTQTRRVIKFPDPPNAPKNKWPQGQKGDQLLVMGASIRLEITDVRVQRLHDITDDEASTEGIEYVWPAIDLHPSQIHPRYCFKFLWHTVYKENGLCGWLANPWVWAITFRRVK